ncbi:hypothetical protein L227DRAFT_618190 [Lentinus tigrinus ALCF2SS1-6]|uniref:Uncharacterized protein n=1 Tax=Lentinus tigrinus ALCF2SS1-6 TaxID=1328759 RepID=A0A5C2RLG8_9APHY|nr:hypothetical protein L227DRAFT_618190 [Lentinus tigrinus ALCF2SS1-6]
MDTLRVPLSSQPLCRFVLWSKDGDMPLWRMVRLAVGERIQLRDLAWLVAACDNVLFTPIEILRDGLWRALQLGDAELELDELSGTQLLRLAGIDRCPLLGFELEDIDRQLGIPRPATDAAVRENRDVFTLRSIRIVLWKQDGEPPVYHRVSFNDDNTLQLGLHSPLDEDLAPWNRVLMWLVDEADWVAVSISASFHVSAEYDSLLLKFPGIALTPGIGRELNVLTASAQVPEGFGYMTSPVTEEPCRNGMTSL